MLRSARALLQAAARCRCVRILGCGRRSLLAAKSGGGSRARCAAGGRLVFSQPVTADGSRLRAHAARHACPCAAAGPVARTSRLPSNALSHPSPPPPPAAAAAPALFAPRPAVSWPAAGARLQPFAVRCGHPHVARLLHSSLLLDEHVRHQQPHEGAPEHRHHRARGPRENDAHGGHHPRAGRQGVRQARGVRRDRQGAGGEGPGDHNRDCAWRVP